MSDFFPFLSIARLPVAEPELRELLSVNKTAAEHGLILSAKDAQIILTNRNEALQNSGRVEFSLSPVKKIAQALASSPFVSREEYAETVCALTDLFYEAKNETLDKMSDDELIDFLIDKFNGSCGGSLELLESRELFRLAQPIRNPSVWEDESVEEGDEDE